MGVDRGDGVTEVTGVMEVMGVEVTGDDGGNRGDGGDAS